MAMSGFWNRMQRGLGLVMAAGGLLVAQGLLGAAARADELPREVRIGWQKGAPIQVLARKQQALETRLRQLGVNSVKWVEFQFGPPMLEALGAGVIDVGSVGDTPPVFAQAGGANLVYAAATPSSEHAVLVPQNSPIKTLADLKGKKIAFGRGSSAHNVALKALAIAGLSLKDVEPVYLSPADATAAFNGGNVDAWVVWDPYFAIAQERYHARALIDTSDKRLVSSAYYMANRDFASHYPQVLAAVVDEFAQITEKAGHHRAELAAVAAEATGIDQAVWASVFQRGDFVVTPVGETQIRQQQQLADTFLALGIIPRKIQVSDIVWHAPARP